MLNGFLKDKVCPICLTELNTVNGAFFFCKKQNQGYSHFEAYEGSRNNTSKFEAIMIDDHYLLFYQNKFQYLPYKNNQFQYNELIDIPGCLVQFKDLDSADKIEEFIQNYKIIC